MPIGLGAGTLGAGIIGGVASAFGAMQSGRDAAAAAERQIEWERERAKNAHQWEVEDLKKAGLNPILSAGGTGATTGGISAPLPDRSGLTNAGTALIEGINSAFSAAEKQANIGKTGAETENITQDTQNKITGQELIQKQIINEGLRSGLISAQKANLEFKNLTEKYNSERAALTYWNNFLNQASQTVSHSANAVSSLIPTKHIKEVKKLFGKGWSQTKNIYE